MEKNDNTKTARDRLVESAHIQGRELGRKLFTYRDSAVIKEAMKNVADLNKDNPWAQGLSEGFSEMDKIPAHRLERLNAMDTFFQKTEKKEKDHEPDMET